MVLAECSDLWWCKERNKTKQLLIFLQYISISHSWVMATALTIEKYGSQMKKVFHLVTSSSANWPLPGTEFNYNSTIDCSTYINIGLILPTCPKYFQKKVMSEYQVYSAQMARFLQKKQNKNNNKKIIIIK